MNSGGDDEARRARVALACLAEPGSREIHDLVSQHGPVPALARVLDGGVPERLAAAVAARAARTDPLALAGAVLARTARLGARVVIPEDDEWPARLADLRLIGRPEARERVDRDTYPPVCLWVRGGGFLDRTLDRSVAVVGARAASSYGVHVATEFGYGLATRGWTVVSGGAYGTRTQTARTPVTGALPATW